MGFEEKEKEEEKKRKGEKECFQIEGALVDFDSRRDRKNDIYVSLLPSRNSGRIQLDPSSLDLAWTRVSLHSKILCKRVYRVIRTKSND